MYDEAQNSCIAVVIPCYRVAKHILTVCESIPDFVARIYVVDDACPEQSGQLVLANIRDPRLQVLFHEQNQGVGGAVMTGYQAALADGADIIVKIDGDGQMDPSLIQYFIQPIASGQADYTKGNRFYDLTGLKSMPKVRIFGNAVLSLLNKLSSGYWNIFDPTNGFTAVHANVCRRLPFSKISNRYFFETDMLFRLNTLRAMVMDIPMDAKYASEVSNLKVSGVAGEFLWKHLRNVVKRIGYNYFLRDMSIASIELVLGLLLTVFGVSFGLHGWLLSIQTNVAATAGTVMIAAMPILLGMQLILSFIGHDIAAVPRHAIHRLLQSNAIQS
jgi:glycosyltransferase involved in cell wall biosynthesis